MSGKRRAWRVGCARPSANTTRARQETYISRSRPGSRHRPQRDESYTKIAREIEAIEYHRKVISIRNLSGNRFHRDTFQSYNGLGLCYSKKKEYKKAIGIFRRLTKIHSKLAGKEHIPSLGIEVAFHNLGLTYCQDGQYRKAIAWHKRALQKFEEKLTPGNSIINLSRRGIARAEKCLKSRERRQLTMARIKEEEILEKNLQLELDWII